MAVGTVKATITGMAGSDVATLTTQFNNLVDYLAVLAARLDGETLADSDYEAEFEAAVSKIADASGTVQ